MPAEENRRYPEFYLRLPNGGPVAQGRPTDELGTNGSRKFVVPAGQPVRPDVVPSFPTRVAGAHMQREELIRQGRIKPSEKWPGWLETAEAITFGSSSSAAAVLKGHSANGWLNWKTEDGRPLGDFMPGM